MIIDLSQVTFYNDYYSATLEDGSNLFLNRIDESLAVTTESFRNSTTTVTDIKGINVAIVSYDEETFYPCPCIIGLGNDLMEIRTDYTEYEGVELTEDNMKYCTIVTKTDES